MKSLRIICHSSTLTLSFAWLCLLSWKGGECSAAQVVPPSEHIETPGPASRLTGLVITEIMYHPPDDDEDLEFIEVFNSQSVSQDLSLYTLSGDVSFHFPADTRIPKREAILIAKNPATLRAHYELESVTILGPYEGQLSNGNGQIQLHNRLGAVLLEVEYADSEPWPIAADGFGSSLVLARPSFGQNDCRSWTASPTVGGNPGIPDAGPFTALHALKFNEIHLAQTGAARPGFIEILNHGDEDLDLDGLILRTDDKESVFSFPQNARIERGERLIIEQGLLPFSLSQAGGRIVLASEELGDILDAIGFPAVPDGESWGRFPDGSNGWTRLSQITPNAPNGPPAIGPVVLNEIMYAPLSGNDDDEFLELYNITEMDVDLSGWEFRDGIRFEFPQGSVLPGQGYLVLVPDKDHFLTLYPDTNPDWVVGNYQGSLANGGERLLLASPFLQDGERVGWVHQAMVHYLDGGMWGHWADRGGSSLELRSPLVDGRIGLNWGDSNEKDRAPWVRIEHEGQFEGGIGAADELDIMLLGEGEMLLDKVEVAFGDGLNKVANSDFENGTQNFVIQGNHNRSGPNTTEGYESQQSLYIRASGGGDNGANRIEYQLISPRDQSPGFGEPVKISAWARWLAGHTDVLFRIQGNWFEGVTSLTPSTSPGTPGARNTLHQDTIRPVIYEAMHSPATPAPSETIMIQARVANIPEDAVVKVHYRLDPLDTLFDVEMNDRGREGDPVAHDGIFTTTLPGQSAQSLIAFHITAGLPDSPPDLVGFFPQQAPIKEALIRVGSLNRAPYFGTYHLLMTERNRITWRQREPLSNEPIDTTLVYNDQRVVYNVGARYRGSPFIRRGYTDPVDSIAAMVWRFKKDQPFLGSTEVNLDSLEQSNGRDTTFLRENTSFWIAEQLDIPFSHQRYVQLFVNGRIKGQIFADVQQPNSDFIESWFPEHSSGEIFKIDDWFEFNDGFGFNNVNATLQNFTRSDGTKNKARYRWSWEKKSNKGLDDDYSSLFELVDSLNSFGPGYTSTVHSIVDVEQWLRVFAVRHIVADWDGYGYRRGKNQFAYKPNGDKWKMLLWDLDFSLGGGSDSTTHNLYDTSDPVISQFYRNPPFNRIYMRIMQEAVDGPLLMENLEARVSERFESFVENGTRGATSPRVINTWVAGRRAYIQQQLQPFQTSLSITSNNGENFSTDSNLIFLTGTAPLEVESILVNGIPYPPQWISETTWEINLALENSVNRLNVQARDKSGSVLRSLTDQITVTFNGTAALAENHLVFSEIMYAPMDPEAEFLEIANTSSTHAFHLGNYRVEGIDYLFPPGSIIRPLEHLVLTRSATAFSRVYGNTTEAFDTYSGRLDNSGEILRLIKPPSTGGTELVVQEIAYQPALPWPAHADGQGASLQRIDLTQAVDRPGNWTSANPELEWKFFSTTGVANDNRLLLFHSPFLPERASGQLEGLWDAFITFDGERIPYQVMFSRDAAGNLLGLFTVEENGFEVPLIVTLNRSTITYAFSEEPGSPTWVGRFDVNENRITGTYSETQLNEIPFEMTPREVVPPERIALIDRLFLATGDRPETGENLIENGDFEEPLIGNWTLSESHVDSMLTNETAYSGQQALKLVSRRGGEGLETSVWQEIPLTPGNTYTLSYWYLPSDQADQVTIKLADGSLDNGSHTIVRQAPYSPGQPNPVQQSLPPFESLWLNEIGLNEAGTEIWLELFNAEDSPVDLSQYRLALDDQLLQDWSFPNGSELAGQSFGLVQFHSNPVSTLQTDPWSSNLPLSFTQGSLYLYKETNGLKIIADHMAYELDSSTVSFGRIPDGKSGVFTRIENPTPQGQNTMAQSEFHVVINEWMPANIQTIRNPSDDAFDDWLELYNPGPQPVNLLGYGLSDDPDEPEKFVFTRALTLAPGDYFLLWADDNKVAQGNEIHLPFRLSRNGESIILSQPDGTLADRVDFGPVADDQSLGRFPDGTSEISEDLLPTPGLPNRTRNMQPDLVINTTTLQVIDGHLHLQWNSQPDTEYEVEMKTNLQSEVWIRIATYTAVSTESTFQLPIPEDSQNAFIRIKKNN